MKMPHWPVPQGFRDIDLGLSRVLALLERLGNPQDHLPPVIHVAGTNGKGSTIAFMRAILEAAGYCCHVYTSPHLVEFNERIVVAGEVISDDYLRQIIEECRVAAGDDISVTFFEGTTVGALLAFSRVKADVVLLETGLGGRLDATNVVARPLLTVITPISMDHEAYLGNTLTSIATEKAGIIKEHVPCVVGKQKQEVEGILMLHAQKHSASLVTINETLELFPLGLVGRFQEDNARLALTALQQVERVFDIGKESIKIGLTQVSWPARLQRLYEGELFSLLPSEYELWVDGGHNSHAAEIIAQEIRQWDRPVYMIVGMLDDKDISGYFRPFSGCVKKCFAVTIPDDNVKSMDIDTIVTTAKEQGISCYPASSVKDALMAIVSKSRPCAVIVSGSLYLVGSVLEENLPKGKND